jgi:hypothetical protein
MTALIRRPRKERLLPGKPKEATVALEAQFDLVCHVQFAADGRNFGAYLLRLGEKYRKDSGLESLSAIDSRYAFRGILLNILQIIFSITEPQTRRSRHLLQMGNHFQEFSEMKVPLNIASST